jgi:hypothetical protein
MFTITDPATVPAPPGGFSSHTARVEVDVVAAVAG